MQFVGQNAVITGACNRGILFEATKQLLAAGIKNVALLDISDGNEIVSELKAEYPTASEIRFIKIDVTERDQIESAFKTLMDSWKRIDLVLCGTGVANEHNIELTIGVNLIGLIYTVLSAMNYMSKEQGGNGGVILTVASVAGLDPCARAPIYAASKHGVMGFVRSLAHEYYPEVTGIKFVTVCPGLCATKLVHTFQDEGPLYPGILEIPDGGLDGPVQTPEEVGKSLFDALKVSENGSIWLLDNATFEPVIMNNYFSRTNT